MKKILALVVCLASLYGEIIAMKNQPDKYDIFSFFKDVQSVFEVVREEYDSAPCAMTSVITAGGLTYLVVGFDNGDLVLCRPDGSDWRIMNYGGKKIKSLSAITTSQGQTYIVARAVRDAEQSINVWKLDGELIDSFDCNDYTHSLVCIETKFSFEQEWPEEGNVHTPEVVVGSRWGTCIYAFSGVLEDKAEYVDYINYSGFIESADYASSHMTALATRHGDTFIITADYAGDVIRVQRFDGYHDLQLKNVIELNYPSASLLGLHAFNSDDGNAYLIAVGRKGAITKWNLDAVIKWNLRDGALKTIQLPHHKRIRKFSFNEVAVDNVSGRFDAFLVSFDDEIGFVCFDDNVSVFMENHELVMIKEMYPNAECWSVHMFTTPQGETFAALGIVKNPAESRRSTLIIKRVFFTHDCVEQISINQLNEFINS